MIRRWMAFIPVIAMTLAVGAPARAQEADSSASTTARPASMEPAYDLAKEVKIEGTIQKIEVAGSAGPIGTHILIQTPQGVVDAHLGFGMASKPDRLGIVQGQSVTVTGMMQSFGSTNVLMARILTTPNHIFVLRNEHGIPVRAVPRTSAQTRTLEGGL